MPYDYQWLVADNSASITTGAGAAMLYGGVIQPQDGYGGYNTRFTLPPGILGQYHVHFKAGSTQVIVIRFIPAGGQGINVVKLKDNGTGVSLNKLYKDTLYQGGNYPNSFSLLKNLRDAVENLSTGPNNQYQ